MTQTQRIYRLLVSRGDIGVTALDALSEEGVFRLAARIWELRQAGHQIEDRKLRTSNGAHVSRYVLIEEPRLWT